MPYIKKEQKVLIDIEKETPRDPGELNYAITKLILSYHKTWGTSYRTFNDIVGALEGAKLEFYRRYIAPYEDKKIKENGDV